MKHKKVCISVHTFLYVKLYSFIQIGSAERASYCLHRNIALAVRAFFGGCGHHFFIFSLPQILKLIDGFYKHENHKSHDEKVDDCSQKGTVFYFHISYGEGKIGQIGFGEKADDGRNHVVDQGVDNRLKGSSDDNAYSQVHYVAAQGKFLKFF